MELDPLLKDLVEKKLVFRKNVACLTAELKDLRRRLASQEENFTRETQTRKIAEARARSMEDEIGRLHICLGEKDWELQASRSATKQYLQELDDLRSKLFSVQATAGASVVAAKSAMDQCLLLQKELDARDAILREHETRVHELGKRVDLLQKNLEAREFSQIQLKDDFLRLEKEIMHAVASNAAQLDCDLRKVMEVVSSNKSETMDTLLNANNGEIARWRDELKFLSENQKLKSMELELQLEKHQATDQELKKRVLKLEFSLQEARSQIRRLQKMEGKRENTLKELRDKISTMKKQNISGYPDGLSFWESPGLKIFVSISLLFLVLYTKR
ncbi:Tropomyosin domain-containing protein [Dioscorea alata]|uniref:Tropomyosin domain-containing protein n=1 Tax=Dioscorea alata TaxID=55571 RepID=A0ACB7VUF8_DIOAL|nr:Tropomyosin domain-containing protein [Dioscorea alata]